MIEWRKAKNLVDVLVSSSGELKRPERKVRNGKGYRLCPEVELTLQEDINGYLFASISQPGSTHKSVRVHHLVAEVFLGKRPEGYVINHKDGNKKNNVLSNLEYVSQQDNIKHAVKNFLHKPKFLTTMLNEEEVKDRYNSGISAAKLADTYSVSVRTIYRIINNEYRVYSKGFIKHGN